MPLSPGTVDSAETHISMLFFTPDRVYKLLKPVDTGFVSFVDRDDRLEAAATEFRLNQRISPDVYLGLSDLMEDGHLAERMIVMRRLPADRQLDQLVDHPDFRSHVREAARLVASFHARLDPVLGADAWMASAETVAANWSDNFDALAPLADTVIPADELGEAKRLVDRFIAGRETLFGERVADGRIVDGHGDLRAEHVFCLDDGPRVIDCLAFRQDYRVADVLNDVAFLAMDLHRLAGPDASAAFIRDYDEFSNEHHPSTLAHHYVAYRAHVRAKVAAVRHGQGDTTAAAEARRYHALALDHLRVGQVRLVLVGGGAGAGKSTVAEGVAERMGAIWLRSDEIRKAMAGVEADQHVFEPPGAGIYHPTVSDEVYGEMLCRAESLLERGESVVLDATWSSESHREAARALAERAATTITELNCVVPLPIAKERIARRMASIDNPSDATPEIAAYIADHFDEWSSAQVVDTARSIPDSIDMACRSVIGGRPSTEAAADSEAVTVDGSVLMSYDSIRFYLSKDTVLTLSSFNRRNGPRS